MIKTRYCPVIGLKADSLIKLRTSSIPRLEAPSSSKTSGEEPFSIERQLAHSLQGSKPFLLRQLTDLAKIRAVDVLPVPFCPVNKKACGSLEAESILLITSRTAELSRSVIVFGLYFRYSIVMTLLVNWSGHVLGVVPTLLVPFYCVRRLTKPSGGSK